MRVDFLCNHPEHVETVAGWIFGAWGDGTSQGRERASVRVRERLRDDAVPLTLVALDADDLVGTVSLFKSDLEGRENLSPWLAALFVPPERRGLGIGTALAERVVEVAEELGYARLYLQAQDAREFYSDLGWTVYEELETERGTTSVMVKELLEPTTLLYRADAGTEIGLGHVVHAIRLDECLRARRLARVQVIGRLDEPVVRLLGERGMLSPIRLLEDVSELEQLQSAMDESSSSVIAFNHPKESLEASVGLFSDLRTKGILQVHFDDPMSSSASADLVVNALPHVDWGVDLRSHPAAYEGLAYFLPDPEFVRIGAHVRDGDVRHALISMGGGDAPNISGVVLDALGAAGFSGTADVVVGVASPHLETLERQGDAAPFDVRVHAHLPSLAPLADAADIAFSALGLTTYEFASTGLPTVIVAGSELNAKVAEIYGRDGVALSLGYYRDWSAGSLADRVREILGDRELRRAMSQRGPEIVDGRGADRVCGLIGQLLERGSGA